MRIALAQLRSTDSPKENFEAARRKIILASRAKAECIFFPENLLYMGPAQNLFSIAKEIEPWAVDGFSELAIQNQIGILIGSMPIPNKTLRKVWNTSLFIDSKGKTLAKYQKIHLFDIETPKGLRMRESREVMKGTRLADFHFRRAHFGMSICYDVRFPLHYQTLAKRGCDVLLVPSAFTKETGEAHWHTLLRARAIENLAYVVAPAQCGKHPGKGETFGHSVVYSPWGDLLLESGTRPDLRCVDLDLSLVSELRQKFGPKEKLPKRSRT